MNKCILIGGISFIKRHVNRLFNSKVSFIENHIILIRETRTKKNAFICFSITFSKIIFTIIHDKTFKPKDLKMINIGLSTFYSSYGVLLRICITKTRLLT